MYSIYLITNSINEKKYVGKTSLSAPDRWKQHLNDTQKGRNGRIGRAIRKYGKDSFQIITIDNASNNERACEFEKYYIALYETHKKSIGYNLTMGGDGGTFTEEGRKKLSEKSKKMWAENYDYMRSVMPSFAGHKHSPETIEKLRQLSLGKFEGDRNPFYGQTHAEATRVLMSELKKESYIGEGNPFFGKTHTEEAKDKSRAWHKAVGWRGERSPVFRTDLPNEKIKELYLVCRNSSEVARQLGVSQGTIYNRLRRMELV
jgi:group I intron endonuclease